MDVVEATNAAVIFGVLVAIIVALSVAIGMVLWVAMRIYLEDDQNKMNYCCEPPAINWFALMLDKTEGQHREEAIHTNI